MSRRLSQEEFENKVKQMYGDDYEVIGKYITKSGLSHCFKDIEILCEEIKGKK